MFTISFVVGMHTHLHRTTNLRAKQPNLRAQFGEKQAPNHNRPSCVFLLSLPSVSLYSFLRLCSHWLRAMNFSAISNSLCHESQQFCMQNFTSHNLACKQSKILRHFNRGKINILHAMIPQSCMHAFIPNFARKDPTISARRIQ